MRPGTQRPIVYVPLNQYEYSTFVHRSRHEVIPRAEDPQLSSAGELCEMSLKIDLEAGLRPPPPPESGTPDNRFIFQRKIGQGAEGIVYAAVPSDQLRSSDGSSSGSTGEYRKSVAIKVITGRAFERCRAMRHFGRLLYTRTWCTHGRLTSTTPIADASLRWSCLPPTYSMT